MTILLVIWRASSRVLPFTSSVALLEVAMAAPQPKVLNFTSVITSSSTLMYIRMMSPHLALPTVPTPLGSSISPMFRGFMKWSMTCSVYSIYLYLSYRLELKIEN